MKILIKNFGCLLIKDFISLGKKAYDRSMRLTPPFEFEYEIVINEYYVYSSENEDERNKVFEKLSDMITNAFNNGEDRLFIDINKILKELKNE